MVGLNKLMVIGNIGTDPEMRYTPNGNPVTSFRLATSRSYTAADGERRQDTEWFTVVAWNQLAEQCNQFLTKGRRAYVEGRISSHTWSGQDGQNRFRNEIIADKVLFLDRAPAGGQGSEQGSGQGSEQGSGQGSDLDMGRDPEEIEDLPF
jgi:single-strand DNA-binding protein